MDTYTIKLPQNGRSFSFKWTGPPPTSEDVDAITAEVVKRSGLSFGSVEDDIQEIATSVQAKRPQRTRAARTKEASAKWFESKQGKLDRFRELQDKGPLTKQEFAELRGVVKDVKGGKGATGGASVMSRMGVESVQQQERKAAIGRTNVVQRMGAQFGSGLASGVLSIPEGIAGLAGFDVDLGSRGLQEDIETAYPTTGFAEKLAKGVGSTASAILPGMGLTKLAGLTGKAAIWANSIASAALESTQQSVETYHLAREQGMDEGEARQAARMGALVDTVATTILDRFGIFRETAGAMKSAKAVALHAISTAPPEALQEGIQQINQNYQTGRPLAEGLGESALLGGAIGTLFGGAGAIHQGIQERRQDRQIEDHLGMLKALALQSTPPVEGRLERGRPRAPIEALGMTPTVQPQRIEFGPTGSVPKGGRRTYPAIDVTPQADRQGPTFTARPQGAPMQSALPQGSEDNSYVERRWRHRAQSDLNEIAQLEEALMDKRAQNRPAGKDAQEEIRRLGFLKRMLAQALATGQIPPGLRNSLLEEKARLAQGLAPEENVTDRYDEKDLAGDIADVFGDNAPPQTSAPIEYTRVAADEVKGMPGGGKTYTVSPAVVSLHDLTPSHRVESELNFPRVPEFHGYQPRDHNVPDKRQYVGDQAWQMRFDELASSDYLMNAGRIKVDPQGHVLQGNTRVLIYQFAQKYHPELWAEFQQKLRDRFPGVEGVADGVPIDVVQGELTQQDIEDIGKVGNESQSAPLTPAEQARVDSEALPKEIENRLRMEGGASLPESLKLERHRGLVKDWLGLIPENQRNSLLVENGSGDLSEVGRDRMARAILFRALGPEAFGVLRDEGTTAGAGTRILNGLSAATDSLFRVRAAEEQGNKIAGEFRQLIIKALDEVSAAKEAVSKGHFKAVEGYFNQPRMMTTPEEDAAFKIGGILALSKSAKQVAEAIRRMATGVVEFSGGGVFGEEAAAKSPLDVISDILEQEFGIAKGEQPKDEPAPAPPADDKSVADDIGDMFAMERRAPGGVVMESNEYANAKAKWNALPAAKQTAMLDVAMRLYKQGHTDPWAFADAFREWLEKNIGAERAGTVPQSFARILHEEVNAKLKQEPKAPEPKPEPKPGPTDGGGGASGGGGTGNSGRGGAGGKGVSGPQTEPTGPEDHSDESPEGVDESGPGQPDERDLEAGNGLRRPSIRTTRAQLTQTANPELVPEDLHEFLDPHQIHGAALSIQSMIENNAFVNMDGPGVGKTRQILAAAEYWRRQGRPVLIVGPAAVLRLQKDQSYYEDSKTMKVELKTLDDMNRLEPGTIRLASYNVMGKIALPKGTVVIFDESQNTKNTEGDWHQKARQLIMQADKVMLASATFADKGKHFYYLAYTGLFKTLSGGSKTGAELMRSLGMNPNGSTGKGFTRAQIDLNISKAIDGLIQQGAAIKRELNYAPVSIDLLPNTLTPEIEAMIATIKAAFAGPMGGRRVQQQIRLHLEAMIAPQIARQALLETVAGRKVVIFTQTHNPIDSIKRTRTSVGEIEEVVYSTPSAVETIVNALKAQNPKLRVLEYTGAHNDAENEETLRAWQANEADVIIATTAKGGTGLNLDDRTGEHPRSVIFATPPWAAIEFQQAINRTFRNSTRWKEGDKEAVRVFLSTDSTTPTQRALSLLQHKMGTLGATSKTQLSTHSMFQSTATRLEKEEFAGSFDEPEMMQATAGVRATIKDDLTKKVHGYSAFKGVLGQLADMGTPTQDGIEVHINATAGHYQGVYQTALRWANDHPGEIVVTGHDADWKIVWDLGAAQVHIAGQLENGVPKIQAKFDLPPMAGPQAVSEVRAAPYGRWAPLRDKVSAGQKYSVRQEDVEALIKEGGRTVNDLSRFGGVVGQSTARDFETKGFSYFIGKKIGSVMELGKLAYEGTRNPNIEVMRYWFTDDAGNILGMNAITARGSYFANAKPMERNLDQQGKWGASLSDQAFVDYINAELQRLGATGFYATHNHPTGDPTPSPEDETVTDAFGKLFGKTFRGHVVVDHSSYAIVSRVEGESVVMPLALPDELHVPAVAHSALGALTTPGDLAKAATNALRPGYATIFTLNSRSEISNIIERPTVELGEMEYDDLAAYFGELERSAPNTSLGIVVASETKLPPQQRDKFDQLVAKGIIQNYFEVPRHGPAMSSASRGVISTFFERQDQESNMLVASSLLVRENLFGEPEQGHLALDTDYPLRIQNYVYALNSWKLTFPEGSRKGAIAFLIRSYQANAKEAAEAAKLAGIPDRPDSGFEQSSIFDDVDAEIQGQGQLFELRMVYDPATGAEKPASAVDRALWRAKWARGVFMDTFTRNLGALEVLSPEALPTALAAATPEAQVNALIKSSVPKIEASGGKGSWERLRKFLTESRLRGAEARWMHVALQATQLSDEEFLKQYKTFIRHMATALDGLESHVDQLLANDLYDMAKQIIQTEFEGAARRVTHVMTDEEFWNEYNSEDLQKALATYKRLLEPELAKTHAKNEGYFSQDLGPADTYFPLTALDEEGDPKKRGFFRRRLPYTRRPNPANYFTTGLSSAYDWSMEQFVERLRHQYRNNNIEAFRKTLMDLGVIQRVRSMPNPDEDGKRWMTVGGALVEAQIVEITRDGRIIKVAPGSVKFGEIQPQLALIPLAVHKEIIPIMEQTNARLNDRTYKKILSFLNTVGMAGPLDFIFHGWNIMSAGQAVSPWASTGAVGKLIGHGPLKMFTWLWNVARTDPTTEDALREIQEMAALGLLPSRWASATYSRRKAKLTGSKWVPFGVSLSPMLYGENALDIRARILMYRIAKQMAPNAGPMELFDFVNSLGNYTRLLEGSLERTVKDSQLAPFYTAGSTALRNGMNLWLFKTPIPARTEAPAKRIALRMAQQLSGGAVAAVAWWAFAYKQLWDKWPWEDEKSRFLEIPIPPKYRHLPWVDALYGKEGDAYVGVGFFFPMVERGGRALGLRGVYNATELGAPAGMAFEKGLSDALNAWTHPFTSGPAFNMGFTAATGAEPFVTGLRDITGKSSIQFFPAEQKRPPGEDWFKERAARSVANLNTFYQDVAENLGWLEPVIQEKESTWLRTIIEFGLPRAYKGVHDADAERERMRKQLARSVGYRSTREKRPEREKRETRPGRNTLSMPQLMDWYEIQKQRERR